MAALQRQTDGYLHSTYSTLIRALQEYAIESTPRCWSRHYWTVLNNKYAVSSRKSNDHVAAVYHVRFDRNLAPVGFGMASGGRLSTEEWRGLLCTLTTRGTGALAQDACWVSATADMADES